jgi:hypothetical protein
VRLYSIKKTKTNYEGIHSQTYPLTSYITYVLKTYCTSKLQIHTLELFIVCLYHVPNLTWKNTMGMYGSAAHRWVRQFLCSAGSASIISYTILICEKAGWLKMKFLFPRPCVALACPYKHTPNASFSRHAKSSTTQLSWAWQAIKMHRNRIYALLRWCSSAPIGVHKMHFIMRRDAIARRLISN